jgi:hypothetical protein
MLNNKNNAESVGKFQPRVCFETRGSKVAQRFFATLRELRRVLRFANPRRNSFRVATSRNECVFPGLPKRNPGLELANAFSVVH